MSATQDESATLHSAIAPGGMGTAHTSVCGLGPKKTESFVERRKWIATKKRDSSTTTLQMASNSSESVMYMYMAANISPSSRGKPLYY